MIKRLKPRGILVVVEGIDGAGKSTQCDRLEAWLRGAGWDVARLREPTDGPVGRRIRELARRGRDGVSAEEEMRLFLEDRSQDVRENIQPALERGALVLLDRYYYSSIAYQSAKGLDPGYVRRENEKIAPPADLLFYVSIPADLAMERIEKSRKSAADLFEREDYLEKVKAVFDAMPDPQMVRIDGRASADAVFEKMRDVLTERLAGVDFDSAPDPASEGPNSPAGS
jgi:dTMP kinase